jgi:hypothetical protein
MFVNRKQKGSMSPFWFHITIFDQQVNPQTNLLSQTSSFSLCHLSPWLKKARGVSSSLLLNLSTCLISSMTSFPTGNLDWEKVWQEHLAAYLMMEWTPESLKCKFQELVCKKNPIGDPNYPPYVRKAKQIFEKNYCCN